MPLHIFVKLWSPVKSFYKTFLSLLRYPVQLRGNVYLYFTERCGCTEYVELQSILCRYRTVQNWNVRKEEDNDDWTSLWIQSISLWVKSWLCLGRRSNYSRTCSALFEKSEGFLVQFCKHSGLNAIAIPGLISGPSGLQMQSTNCFTIAFHWNAWVHTSELSTIG